MYILVEFDQKRHQEFVVFIKVPPESLVGIANALQQGCSTHI